MRELKKQYYLRWDEMLLMFVLALGAFLFGEILLAVCTNMAHDDEIFEIGTMMSLAVPLFMMVFSGISALGMCFNLGISMCDTRRRLIPMTLAASYLECLIVAGTVCLLHQLELWIFRVFYPGMKIDPELGFIFQWKYILVACAVVVAVQALFGMLFLKYGKVAFWIIWALWMLACAGIPRITEHYDRYKDSVIVRVAGNVFGIFHNITENGMLAGLTVFAALLILISYIMLRKQQVTI